MLHHNNPVFTSACMQVEEYYYNYCSLWSYVLYFNQKLFFNIMATFPPFIIQKLAHHKRPAFSQSGPRYHLRRMWRVLFASGFFTCLCASLGRGLSVHRPRQQRCALGLFCRSIEEWKWNLAQNAFHASLLMLTNGSRCAFVREDLDSFRFQDGVFIRLAFFPFLLIYYVGSAFLLNSLAVKFWEITYSFLQFVSIKNRFLYRLNLVYFLSGPQLHLANQSLTLAQWRVSGSNVTVMMVYRDLKFHPHAFDR